MTGNHYVWSLDIDRSRRDIREVSFSFETQYEKDSDDSFAEALEKLKSLATEEGKRRGIKSIDKLY